MAVWLKILDTHVGMVPSGRVSQFRASSWGSHTGIHHGKHQTNWTKLDILGVDNLYPYKNRRVNAKMLQNDTTF